MSLFPIILISIGNRGLCNVYKLNNEMLNTVETSPIENTL